MWTMIEEAYTHEDKSQMVDHFNNNTQLFDEKKYGDVYGVWERGVKYWKTKDCMKGKWTIVMIFFVNNYQATNALLNLKIG